MRTISLLIISSIISLPIKAAGLTGEHDISSVNQRECVNSADFEVRLASDHANPDACADARILNFSCAHPGLPQIASIALSAMAMGKKINAWVSGCDVSGQAIGQTLSIIN